MGVGVGAGVFAFVGSQQCESVRAGRQTERPTRDCTSMLITNKTSRRKEALRLMKPRALGSSKRLQNVQPEELWFHHRRSSHFLGGL